MRLIGRWLINAEDDQAMLRFGRVKVKFYEDGNLIYKIECDEADQIIKLSYYVSVNKIVTTQPSAPKTEYTTFFFTETGSLLLEFDGLYCEFIRDNA